MQVSVDPSPVPPGEPYKVTASGGVPPYQYELQSSPPNPPGLTLTVHDGVATVTVPPTTPPGTVILVGVSDSGHPPAGTMAANQVGRP
jgi:hypothetical protein